MYVCGMPHCQNRISMPHTHAHAIKLQREAEKKTKTKAKQRNTLNSTQSKHKKLNCCCCCSGCCGRIELEEPGEIPSQTKSALNKLEWTKSKAKYKHRRTNRRLREFAYKWSERVWPADIRRAALHRQNCEDVLNAWGSVNCFACLP